MSIARSRRIDSSSYRPGRAGLQPSDRLRGGPDASGGARRGCCVRLSARALPRGMHREHLIRSGIDSGTSSSKAAPGFGRYLIDIGSEGSDGSAVTNSTSTKGWANGFLIIGGLLMIPGVGVFFATGGGISISLVAGVLLLLAGGSLRQRPAHQASRETELPPPPEYFEQSESTLGSTDDVRKPLRRGREESCARAAAHRGPYLRIVVPPADYRYRSHREKQQAPRLLGSTPYRLITVDWSVPPPGGDPPGS